MWIFTIFWVSGGSQKHILCNQNSRKARQKPKGWKLVSTIGAKIVDTFTFLTPSFVLSAPLPPNNIVRQLMWSRGANKQHWMGEQVFFTVYCTIKGVVSFGALKLLQLIMSPIVGAQRGKRGRVGGSRRGSRFCTVPSFRTISESYYWLTERAQVDLG